MFIILEKPLSPHYLVRADAIIDHIDNSRRCHNIFADILHHRLGIIDTPPRNGLQLLIITGVLVIYHRLKFPRSITPQRRTTYPLAKTSYRTDAINYFFETSNIIHGKTLLLDSMVCVNLDRSNNDIICTDKITHANQHASNPTSPCLPVVPVTLHGTFTLFHNRIDIIRENHGFTPHINHNTCDDSDSYLPITFDTSFQQTLTRIVGKIFNQVILGLSKLLSSIQV